MRTMKPKLTPDQKKALILTALQRWISQRPGLDFGNYGDLANYLREMRSIQKDLSHARQLLRAVELSSITGDELLAAFSAYSGRMKWENGKLDYCTGQYWPTEYRRVVCAIAARALWDHKRKHCMPEPENGAFTGLSAGEWLRRSFRREYGRGIAARWFD